MVKMLYLSELRFFQQKSALSRSAKRISVTFLALSAIITGCEQVVQPPPSASTPNQQESSASLVNPEEALRAAQSAVIPEERQALLLNAAIALQNRGDIDWAMQTFEMIEPDLMDSQSAMRWALQYSALALQKNDLTLAEAILTYPDISQRISTYPLDTQISWHEQRAQVFLAQDRPIIAVEERTVLSRLLTSFDNQSSNNEALWFAMTHLSSDTLTTLAENEPRPQLQGWYSLAAISRDTTLSLRQQLQQVESWQSRWPNHPANLSPPTDIQLLSHWVENQPQSLALLLPLEGGYASAGVAIQDGFMAAYFESIQRGNVPPQIQVFNTHNADIQQVYDQAVQSGAEAIIGPLTKDNMNQLRDRLHLPVPTLALNASYNNNVMTSNLFELGFAAEDEGQQIADRAWLKGHKIAMILASERDWGKRAAQSFKRRWLELGGDIATEENFGNTKEFSKLIEGALLVNRSKQRRRDMRYTLGRAVEFTPRRRSDVDMIFLAAYTRDARQISPILDFHYAGDLPIFATSEVYSGIKNTKKDRDLDGIYFNTPPWTFSNAAEKRQINRFAHPKPNHHRLYALGVESFRLYPRLRQLQEVPNSRFSGVTGELQLLPGGRLSRSQSWGKIEKGLAKPVKEKYDAKAEIPSSNQALRN